jgi:transposase
MPALDPSTDRPDVLSADDLPDEVATLKRLVLELLASLREERRDKEALRHRLDLLLRRLSGPRGERFAPNQPWLCAELAPGADPPASAAAAPPQPTPRPKRRCRPHGRRRLPEHLPRESCPHELTEAERLCPHCGRPRVDIGVDQSAQLD